MAAALRSWKCVAMRNLTRNWIVLASLCAIGLLLAVWKVRSANNPKPARVSYKQSENIEPFRVVSKDLGIVDLSPERTSAPKLTETLRLKTNQVFRIKGKLANPKSCKPGEYFVLIKFVRHEEFKGDITLNSGVALLTFDPKDPTNVTFDCESPAPHETGTCELREIGRAHV